jgi:hypothetical protein
MSRRVNILKGTATAATSGNFKMSTVDVLMSYGGVFDGGSITLNMYEQGNWEPVTDGTFTAAGQKLLQLAQGIEIQAVTSNGGESMEVNLSASPRY